MTMQLKAFGLAAICAILMTVPTVAHHSHGNYDLSEWVDMEGTVSELVLIVPHSIMYIDVAGEDGETLTWTLEATGVRGILANGVKRGDVVAGDRIKVRCHVIRGGSRACLLGFVTPDHGDMARGHGVELEWD
jgi:hypothetical protein